MARFVTGNTFGTTDTVTAALLNQAVNDAAISTDSVDGSTIEVNSNSLRLKDSGITTAKIADSSSKTTGVTFAKMQHISTAKVLGRSTAGEGDVEEAFDFKDEDDMSSNSATALASQQSIKAYADGGDIGVGQTWQSVTRALDGTSYTNNTGKPIMIKGEFVGSADAHVITISVTPSGGSTIQIVFAQSTNVGGGVSSAGSIIIPDNTSYSFAKTGTSVLTSFSFHELR